MHLETSLPHRPLLTLGLTAVFLSGSFAGLVLFSRYRLRYNHERLALQREKDRLIGQLRLRREIDETIRYFATSLYGKNTVDEILWDVAKNCISRLGFVDCVVYLVDETQQALVQQAAYGNKNPQDRTILGPL